jgi:uncharacterized protein (TIGR03437 family)
MKRVAAACLLLFALTGSDQLRAQEPFLYRKDIVVPQQFGGGATGAPTNVGDFNGDGRPDIAVCIPKQSVLLINTGGGNFAPPIPTSDACGGLVGDFNGDGRLDLVSGNRFVAGRGDGTFLPAREIGPQGVSPRAVAAGDLNGDRKLDLVFYSGPLLWDDETAPATMHVMLAAGDGTFTQSWMMDNLSPRLGLAIIADFNRDGHGDIAVTDGEGGILVFLARGNGSFDTPRRTVTGDDTAYLLAGDFNRDGVPDVASVYSVALGKGDGTFADPVRHPAADVRSELGLPIALIVSAAADFNGDGLLDLAGVPFSLAPGIEREVWVLPGKGDGTLLPPVRYAVGLWPQRANAADLDGDGRADLVVNGAMSNSVSLLRSRAPTGQPLRRAVSAASGRAIVAPGSLATLHASTLASAAQQATPPWPLQLGGVRLQVRDSTGATQLAPLLYLSPGQVNFQVPTGTAVGEATLVIVNDSGSTLAGSMQVNAVAPGVFVIDGLIPFPRPAAHAIRVEPDGSQTTLPLVNCTPDRFCFPLRLPERDARPIYVTLFATGFRDATASRVTCTSNGQPLTVEYAGPQVTPGVEQINVRVPAEQRDLGTIVCSIDAVVTNPVWL